MPLYNVNIPSQIKPYANLAAFPVTGVNKTIYIAEDTNIEYRWNGSVYVVLGGNSTPAFSDITGDPYDNLALTTALNTKANQSDLTQEITDRTNADVVLQGNIDTEESARIATDSAIQSQLDAHEGDLGNPHQTTLEQVRSENNQITGNIDANGNQVDNLSNPVSNQQASTKNYTDAAEANAKAYADSLVISVYRAAGDWDASGNTFPTIGTGTAGAIRRGDTYNVTVAGTPAGFPALDIGDSFYAYIANPGQTAANWRKFEANTEQATESTRGTAKVISAANAADENTLNDQDFVTGKKLWSNFWQRVLALAWTWQLKQTFTTAPRLNSVTASQYLKVDSNKDVVSVGSIPNADISLDSTHRFITDAQLANLANQSGTNTGDNATNATSNTYADGKVQDSITDGVTDKAPSQNAVFDALAGKQDALNEIDEYPTPTATATLSHAPVFVYGYYLNGQKCKVGGGGRITSVVGVTVTFDDDYTGSDFEAVYRY